MNIEEFCNRISNISIKSILYELSATPKPGLVDRENSGAHKDMDFFTFLNSSSVFGSYFYNCTKMGIEFKGNDFRDLLVNIRPIGIKAEKDMFKATHNINTHKGIIFSLGIISAAVGSLFYEYNKKYYTAIDISKRIRKITKGISHELEEAYDKKDLTYGEKLFIKYGVKGIRGELESGLKTVLEYSYPVFTKMVLERKHHINDILVQTLIYLIAYTEDSNILGRHNMDVLNYVQNKAKKALKLGGYFTLEGKEFIKDMDREFINENISPGGAADLLAVNIALYIIENGDLL